MAALNPGPYDIPTRLGTLRVRVAGQGPVVVLWHSLFVDSRSWYAVEEELAARRTLVFIDGPSHGGSQAAVREFTLAECADAAAEVLDQLGVSGAVDWVGSAWGGHVGIVFAAGRPDRCRSLVTLATPVPALAPAERRRIAPLVGLYRRFGPSAIRGAVLSALLSPVVRKTRPEIEEIITDVIRGAPRDGMHRALRSMMLNRPDLTETLPRIKAPALLVAGHEDPLWTVAGATRAAARIPQGGAMGISGSRHLPALEAPAAVVALLLDFWARAADR